MNEPTPETTRLEYCDFCKIDDEHAEINAYNRMLEHAKGLERERNQAQAQLKLANETIAGMLAKTIR